MLSWIVWRSSSFAGPYRVGWVRDFTGHYALGIMALGIGPLIASVVAVSLRSAHGFEASSTSQHQTCFAGLQIEIYLT